MFEGERPLLIAVTLNAARVGSDGELLLLRLESAVRVVTARAFHRALHHLVVKGLAELRFRLRVAAHTQLRLTLTKHSDGNHARILDRRL